MEVPVPVIAGADLRLVLDGGAAVPGVVMSRSEPDRFSGTGPAALVAVPAKDASRVATAVAARQVVVLIRP